jgi:double-stranded uracil-DNA glycosylase
VEVLPDIAGDAPQVVFCGMAGAENACTRDHYYETPGNELWLCMHESGFTPRLRPEDDHRLVEHGLAMTDLVRHRDPEWYEVDALAEKVRAWEPEWLAFTSKTVAAVVARHLGHRRPGLGVAGWDLAGAPVYVLPGMSGANRRRDYDGRPTRLEWWVDLAQLCGRSGPG